MNKNLKKIAKKRFTKRSLRVFSRHPSHDVLRQNKLFLPGLVLIRFGSQTAGTEQYDLELNKPEAVRISSNKLRMKTAFTAHEVPTADWWTASNREFISPNGDNDCNVDTLPYPIVSKHIYGSRGEGNTLIKNIEEMNAFLERRGNNLEMYIFEKYYNYNREYRLHVTEDGCFYTCRKMLKSDTPEDQRWYRNDANSVWIVEENEQFDKPTNWNDVVEASVKALKATGLDFGAVDLRIQSARTEKNGVRENPKFIVVEINSAPSFGEITYEKYKAEISRIVNKKLSK